MPSLVILYSFNYFPIESAAQIVSFLFQVIPLSTTPRSESSNNSVHYGITIVLDLSK